MRRRIAKTLLMVVVGLGITCGMAIAQTKISVWWTIREPVVQYLNRELYFFEKTHPDIKVEIQLVPEATMAERLLPAITTGTGPDLAYIDESFLSPLLNAQALRAIPPDFYTKEKVEKIYGEAIADLFLIEG